MTTNKNIIILFIFKVLKFKKGGPAFTLKIRGELDCEEVEMDVDLVPCFLFSEEKWPQGFTMYNNLERNISDESGNKLVSSANIFVIFFCSL